MAAHAGVLVPRRHEAGRPEATPGRRSRRQRPGQPVAVEPGRAEQVEGAGRAPPLREVGPLQQTHAGVDERGLRRRHVGEGMTQGSPVVAEVHPAPPAPARDHLSSRSSRRSARKRRPAHRRSCRGGPPVVQPAEALEPGAAPAPPRATPPIGLGRSSTTKEIRPPPPPPCRASSSPGRCSSARPRPERRRPGVEPARAAPPARGWRRRRRTGSKAGTPVRGSRRSSPPPPCTARRRGRRARGRRGRPASRLARREEVRRVPSRASPRSGCRRAPPASAERAEAAVRDEPIQPGANSRALGLATAASCRSAKRRCTGRASSACTWHRGGSRGAGADRLIVDRVLQHLDEGGGSGRRRSSRGF